MRSRYAAFALGLGVYLAETLAEGHPDRALPRDAYIRELSRAHEQQRFLGLRILHASHTEDVGEVLFHARIFVKGADHSIVELSDFVREGTRWRYAAGLVVPREVVPVDLAALTPEHARRLAQNISNTRR